MLKILTRNRVSYKGGGRKSQPEKSMHPGLLKTVK